MWDKTDDTDCWESKQALVGTVFDGEGPDAQHDSRHISQTPEACICESETILEVEDCQYVTREVVHS